MRHSVHMRTLFVAALMLLTLSDSSAAFAQGGRGRQQRDSQKGSRRQGPAAVFHTDVPKRLLDTTLARPTDRSVTVVVTAHEDLEASVEYGTTPGEYSAVTPFERCNRRDTTHVLLSSLKPNTRHHYRLRYRVTGTTWSESSPEYTFHSQRPAGEAFCFTVQADSHLDEPTDGKVYLETLKNALAAKPDFHIDLGDTFMTDKYGGREPRRAVGATAPNSTRMLNGDSRSTAASHAYRDAEAQYYAQRYYFGRLCHSAPLFLTLGNHDGEAGWSFSPRNDNISVWSHGMRTSLFPNPTPDSFYSGNTTETTGLGLLQNYYAWRWGDAQFIVLDPFWPTTSKGRSADGWRWTLGREQYGWLRKTLEASDAAFKFVFIHNLVGGNDESARGGAEAAAFFEWGGDDLDGRHTFDTHRPELEMPIHDLLVENGVSIVLHGHDHFFARQERDGVVYQLVPQPGHASKQRTNSKRGGNNPNRTSGNAHRMAAEYGYQSGDFLPGSGCLRIAISPEEATVDYLLSDGNDSDTTVAYSYTLTPGLNDTSERTVQEDAREIAPAPTAGKSVDRRPNFLLLLSDDQDWTGLSVAMHDEIANSKSDYYQTPNLEDLAAQGMRFTDAYAPSPVCSPTRYSLQTGKSPAALHWTKASPTVTVADGYKFIAPTLVRRIDAREMTIGEILQAAGYATAHYGKWHLSGGGPGMHGYGEHDGDTSNGDAAPFTDPNPVDIFGMGKRAAEFMAKNKREGKPFFIQMSYHALHYPENAITASKEKYENLPAGRMHGDPLRAAISEDLDSGVGLLLEDINKLGIADNTYVIFMSDNGGGGRGGKGKGGTARPVQGGKGSLWEGGIRVPLIIRGPNIEPNTFCHVPVVGYDLFPTFCELAGVTEPQPNDIEGGSIAALLRNGDAGQVQRPREEIVFHFPHYQSGDGPHSAIRIGNEKLIRFDETGDVRLYDLSRDMGEQDDLSIARPERTKELLRLLDAYLVDVDAQHVLSNPSYDPNREPTNSRRSR